MVQPSIFIPHGGGPCFFMDWDPPNTWNSMANFLRGFINNLPQRPDRMVVVSAHWECPKVTLTASEFPGLIFDYYGFPEHTYQLSWPAPGSLDLAQRVSKLLTNANIPCQLDHDRGFDHGVFIPLMLAVPEGDIPTVQLSLHDLLDPGFHIRIGEALSPLREENVLIIGSGMSFHDISALMGRSQNDASKLFDDWLLSVVRQPRSARTSSLMEWQQAPGGKLSHPTAEHLAPLFVAAGAGLDDLGLQTYADQVMGANLSAFQFG